MTDYTIETAVTFDSRHQFYDAVAIVKWTTLAAGPCGDFNCCQVTKEHKWVTRIFHSLRERSALNYALTEVALAFERGDINP